MSKDPGTYLFDAEKATEMARLSLLGKVVTNAIGSYFPGVPAGSLESVRDVLDIGCGPGEWAIGVASRYPHMTVTGVDISEIMMKHANMQAQAQKCYASFRVMDVTKPLDFPDASFNLLHIRFIVGFMRREKWPELLAECYRITRPGGYICITEGDQYAMSSEALITTYTMMTDVLWKMGISFVSRGQSFVLTPHLKSFILQAGYRLVQRDTDFLDFSAGEAAHDSLVRGTMQFFAQFKPAALKYQAISDEDYEALRNQALHDMQQPDFRGLWYLYHVIGQKP